MGFLVAGTLGWCLALKASVLETAQKQATKPWSSTMRVPRGQRGAQGSNVLWGLSGDSVQWRRYGVPWYPRGTEFQAGRDQMLRTMNN